MHFNLGYWDWHGDNFTAGKQQNPMFDAASPRCRHPRRPRLLDSTIVLALGEMGAQAQDRQAARDGRPDAITGTTPNS